MTQKECAKFLGVSLRTYIRYENGEVKDSMKYQYMAHKLSEYGEEKDGVLSLEFIKNICASVFDKYAVEYCFLFGSYAKGRASASSDVDLFISTPLSGLKIFGLVEELRTALNKKVDVLDQAQIVNNPSLAGEILKDGIKIYG